MRALAYPIAEGLFPVTRDSPQSSGVHYVFLAEQAVEVRNVFAEQRAGTGLAKMLAPRVAAFERRLPVKPLAFAAGIREGDPGPGSC